MISSFVREVSCVELCVPLVVDIVGVGVLEPDIDPGRFLPPIGFMVGARNSTEGQEEVWWVVGLGPLSILLLHQKFFRGPGGGAT